MLQENLKKARADIGLSQQQVAEIIGVERSAYTYYESGKIDVPIKRLILLARLYNMTVSDLLSEKEDKLEFRDTSALLRPNIPTKTKNDLLSLTPEDRELLVRARLLRNMGRGEELDAAVRALCDFGEEE